MTLNLTSNVNFGLKLYLSSLIIFFGCNYLMRYINLLISNHIDYEIRNNVWNKIKISLKLLATKNILKSLVVFTILTTDPKNWRHK